jgi:hypothetical protein
VTVVSLVLAWMFCWTATDVHDLRALSQSNHQPGQVAARMRKWSFTLAAASSFGWTI